MPRRNNQTANTLVSFMLGIVLIASGSVASAHQYAQHWLNTATDGSGLLQGDPTTLTWGFVADGTPLSEGGTTTVGTSSLVSFFDGVFAETASGNDVTNRTWYTHFVDSFERWNELSGVNYVYEPNDDGVLHAAQAAVPLTRGFLGVRADVRIAAALIDGESGTLAFNFFPDNGDMQFDIGDGDFFADPIGFQNVIMHEAGHGLGIEHVESDDVLDADENLLQAGGQFLMEPFASTDFFGPQFDDILAVHRGYGDVYEKSNGGSGNDIAANATHLGLLRTAQTLTIGQDSRPVYDATLDQLLPPAVEAEHTDFISIDGLSDSDFLSFEIEEGGTFDLTVTPHGALYPEAPQGLPQVDYDTAIFNNLSIQLFDQNGTTQLASDNSGAVGEIDSITGIELTEPGTYFVRIEGEVDLVQLYEVNLISTSFSPYDFDEDGLVDCSDINLLTSELVANTGDLSFDLDGDGTVTESDLDVWLQEAALFNGLASALEYGDANLDGVVNEADFVIWEQNRFTNGAWCSADFNIDGFVDVSDFNIWHQNRAVEIPASVVPEAQSGVLLLAGLLLIGFKSRRRR